MRNFILNVVIFGFIFCSSCQNKKKYYLKKTNIADDKQIDTIQIDSLKGIYIVNVVTPGSLGDFENELAFVKKVNTDSAVVYSLEQGTKEGARFYQKYITYSDLQGVHNWGWFYIKDGEVQKKLPGIDKILDSLKNQKRGKFNIFEANGYINIVNNGSQKTINYGQYVTKYKDLDFENLSFKLYKLINGELKIISDFGDDLWKQKDGLYFLPPPGYGNNRIFEKERIFVLIDSVSRLKVLPKEIEIYDIKR